MEEQIRNYQKILKTSPTDVPAFTALEELYKGTDSWRELVQLYEDRIKHVRDFEQEQVLLEKSAGVWLHKISDLSKALTCYGRILRINPESRVALEGLRDIHRSKNEWKKLAEVSEKLVVLTEDSVERAELYQRLGTLYIEHLARKESALVAWGHALAADPKRTDVMASLRELYEGLGYYSKVWELLERERESGESEKEDLGQKYLEVGRKLLAEPLFEEICRKSLEQAKGLLADSAVADEILAELEEAKSAWEGRVKKLRVEAVEAGSEIRILETVLPIWHWRRKKSTSVEMCTWHPFDNGAMENVAPMAPLRSRTEKVLRFL